MRLFLFLLILELDFRMNTEKVKTHILNLNDEELLALFKKVIREIESSVERMSSARGRSLKSAVELYESSAKDSVDVIDKLAEVDHNCDNAWRAMAAQLLASSVSLNPDTQAAAQVINTQIEKYGDPTELEYDEEYTIICKALLALENANLAETLKQAKLDDEVKILRVAYDKFNDAQDDGFAGLKFGAFKNARNTAIKAWNKYVDAVDVLVNEGNADAAKVIAILEKAVG